MSTDRKYKYGEKTVLVSGFRVPVSKVQDFKDSAYAKLDSYMNQGKTVLDIVKVPEERFEQEDNGIIGVGKLPSIKKYNKPPKIATENIVKHIVCSEARKYELGEDGYEYEATVPLGMDMINIIGQKLHKHYSEEIYYIRHPNRKGFNVAVLYSEKEVKDFIRKEIVK